MYTNDVYKIPSFLLSVFQNYPDQKAILVSVNRIKSMYSRIIFFLLMFGLQRTICLFKQPLNGFIKYIQYTRYVEMSMYSVFA